MATEDYFISGVTLVFSAGVAYGMVKTMLSNLTDRVKKVEEEDCEDVARKLLFDESAMPRFQPVAHCILQHANFAAQLEKIERKMESRDHEMLDVLKSIHTAVSK